MTLLERRRQQFFQSKVDPSEHFDDGTARHDSASYEGTVYVCGCGERFEDKNQLDEHITRWRHWEASCEKP